MRQRELRRNSISTNLVIFLLDKGADFNQGGADGWTPLLYPTNGKKPENVKLLLGHGADMEKAD